MNAVVGLVATSDATRYDGWGERREDMYDLGPSTADMIFVRARVGKIRVAWATGGVDWL